ncbi:LOW QUALITY PROTEIN: hypothetical protein KIPB_006038 [Kipferlia bialata]|uniref:Transmembrane protein n=1 Tax=Kipferlia bialata TaxID=797122 RepID=A0A9K3CZH4_9EUKA|nr:LOW QUALITY PROTEIN: hypothetical protein KIPB_006038 [Kipferlia bialata]
MSIPLVLTQIRYVLLSWALATWVCFLFHTPLYVPNIMNVIGCAASLYVVFQVIKDVSLKYPATVSTGCKRLSSMKKTFIWALCIVLVAPPLAVLLCNVAIIRWGAVGLYEISTVATSFLFMYLSVALGEVSDAIKIANGIPVSTRTDDNETEPLNPKVESHSDCTAADLV